MEGSKPRRAGSRNATADIALALGPESTLSLTGTATIAKLLPPEMAALTGDSVPFQAHATLREDGAVAIDALTLGLAAGRLTADAVVGRPDREIAAHIAVSLPDLGRGERSCRREGERLGGAARHGIGHGRPASPADRGQRRIARCRRVGSGAGTGAGDGFVEREAGRPGGASRGRGGWGAARPRPARRGAARSRPRSALVAVGQRQTRFQPRRADRSHRARRRDRCRRERQDRRPRERDRRPHARDRRRAWRVFRPCRTQDRRQS